MKLKQTLWSLCSFAMLTALTSTLNAQVTIGSVEKPVDGALLQLKTETGITDGTANAIKGLGLPRVALVAFQQLEPCAVTNATNNASHTGLIVYNTTNSGVFTPGLYAWDGTSWQRVTRDTPQGFGPWYEVGSNPAVPSVANTTDSYLNAKVVVGNTNIINNATLSVHGNTVVDGNVTIQPTAGTETGLILPNGSGAGRVLTSDTQGNAIWISGAKQLQTMVTGNAGSVKFTFPNVAVNSVSLINFFNTVLFDGAKDDYGVDYGWNTTTNQYRVPVTGKYRIAMNVYFGKKTPVTLGLNHRVYAYRNNVIYQTPGFVSIAEASNDQTAYAMGVVNLNKGDLIDFRVVAPPIGATSVEIILWAGHGHTFILIESL